jgi:hypothetical protein
MSKAVQEEINKLFEAVKDLRSLEDIQPHCEAFNEFISTKTDYSKDSLGTVLSRCDFYKKFRSITLEQGKNADLIPKHDKNNNVKGHELKHYVLLICGLDNKEWRDRNLTKRVMDRISGDGQEIDIQSYFESTGKLLESSNPHELAVGLIAATGRRPHEILARATFSSIQDKDYWVMFEGQGKKRGENPIFPIASLFPAFYIVKKLQKLRELTDYFVKEVESEFPDDIAAQNRSIDNKRGQSLRRVVKEFFGDKYDEKPLLEIREGDDQNNCKSLRAAYLCLATERDSKGSLGSKMLHAAKLAGHFIDTESVNDDELRHLLTTLGYMDYYTKNTVPFAPVPTIKEEIKEDETMKTPKITANKSTKVGATFEAYNEIRTLAEKSKCTQIEVVDKLIKDSRELEKMTNQLTEANEKITQLEAKIKELETVETKEETAVQETVVQETVTSDVAILEAKVNAQFKNLEELIKALQPATPVEVVAPVEVAAPATVVEVPTPVEVAKLEKVDTARERNLTATFKGMSNAALWQEKKSGVVEEKISRCFDAMTEYNNKSEQSDKIAVTNIALSQLAGANRQEVSKWVEANKGRIIKHNTVHGMHSSKDPNNVVTYYNKGKNTDKAIEAIRNSLKLNEVMAVK